VVVNQDTPAPKEPPSVRELSTDLMDYCKNTRFVQRQPDNDVIYNKIKALDKAIKA